MLVKTNSAWQIFESMKVLEIKTSMLLNLDFANNTVLLWFFLFFLIIDLYFLILAVIKQIGNPIEELVIYIGISNKEGKGEIDRHSVIVQIVISE